MKKVLCKGIATFFVMFFLSGCAEMVGVGIGISEGLKERERQNLRYCGPDTEYNLAKDKESFWTRPMTEPNFDKICGKSDIEFVNRSNETYEPTTVENLEIYKEVGHFGGEEEIAKDEIPIRSYHLLGTLKFPERWYYGSTINKYLKDKMSELGAHAILEYHTYQDAAMALESETTGELLNVYRMRMEAKLIRYTD